MGEKFHLDIYMVLITALIPVFLLNAWGLTQNHERVLANRACEDTTSYLEEASGFAPEFRSAGTLENADGWLSLMRTMRPPQLAEDLHNSIMTTVTYAMNTDPDLDTTQPAGVYVRLTPFRSSIMEARAQILEKCPELAGQIPTAFPMFFTEEKP